MALNLIQPSLASGEITPALYARVDLDRYLSSVAFAENFFVDYHGGMSSRPGSRWCGQAKGFTGGSGAPHRLIPFIYSSDQAYILEFGHQYIRVFFEGEPILLAPKAITAMTNANPGVLTVPAHGFAFPREVVISSMAGVPQLTGNFYAIPIDANHVSLQDLFGNTINTTSYGVYTGGSSLAEIYEVASPYADVDIPLLKYVQEANVMTLTHPLYPEQDFRRTTPTTFTLTASVYAPSIDSPTGLIGTYSGGGGTHANIGYVVTAVSLDGKEESLPSNVVVVNCVKLDGINNINKLRWTAPAQAVSHYNVYKWGPIRLLSPIATIFGYLGQTFATAYTDTGLVEPDYSRLPPQYSNPSAPGQITSVAVTGGGAFAPGTYIVPLTITDGTGVGAEGYAVVDPSTNVAIGAVLTRTGHGYTAPTITAGTATFSATLNSLTGTYPATAGYFQQRKLLGGALETPNSFTASQPGAPNNFDVTPISLPSDSITATVASLQVNAIKSISPVQNGALLLTSGGGFLVTGGSPTAAITPENVTALPQASSGCNDLQPLVINFDVLYCQAKGAVVRDLAFSWQYQTFSGTDRSALSSHLFLNHTLVDWTWVEEPFRLVSLVRSDGTLLTMAYVPEQEIIGWTHWTTNGYYSSVASVPEGDENAHYTIARRFVQGQWVEYIERFASRVIAQVEDAWCVDAALQLPQTYRSGGLVFDVGVEVQDALVNATSLSGVFLAGDVGSVIWAGTGKAEIVTYINVSSVTIRVLKPFEIVPNDPDNTPRPYAEGEWSLDAPVTHLYGLRHLNGLQVTGLADGVALPLTTVVDGELSLPQPVTKVIIGLGFRCRLKTLRLDLGLPTQQAKFKFLPGVTLRVKDTGPGVQAGADFDLAMYDFRELIDVPYSVPNGLFTGDVRQAIDSTWDAEGQVCFQQSAPYPVTVLGVIPEVVLGDTQR